MKVLRRAGYFAIGAIALVLFLILVTDILPGEREAVNRATLAISTVALVATVLFQFQQYRIIEHTLNENDLRSVPHLALSTARLPRDDWEKLEVEITLFNVGLGNLFVVSSQMFWTATPGASESVTIGTIENPDDERYPLAIEAGDRATLLFAIDPTQAMADMVDSDELISQPTTTPSEYVNARIEIYYRGVGRDAATPLIHHLYFTDIRIAAAIEPKSVMPAAPGRTIAPVVPPRTRKR